MLSAILAIFEALAPFAGGIALRTGRSEIPVGIQLLDALSPAMYAAVLILIASLLMRRQRWIQQAQIFTLSAAVLLQGIALAVTAVRGEIDVVPVLTTVLIMLFNALAVMVMTERRVRIWYTEQTRTPRYIPASIALWMASDVALIVVAGLR
jgi:hypothetical protein